MHVVDIIRTKRDGGRLARDEIEFFVAGVTAGTIPDYQAAALLMAVCLRGMTPEETAWLTDAMVRSGERLDLSGIPGMKVDKHSTGGVGDKTSLVVAPLAAACGAIVPMMSGRGLGHTGGTLDKLQAIPGFRVDLTASEITVALAEVGCVLIGQTAWIAPADRRLYALRDVTGTIESIPLICASILSKKIAEGIDALVLDVKTGRGAFMRTEPQARELAQALVDLGQRSGLRTEALITGMDAPLGRAVGNAIEVVESIETLKGRGPDDLEALSVTLAGRMLSLAGRAPTPEEGERRARAALASGAGLETFRRIIAGQGGDPAVIDDYDRLPAAPGRHVVCAEASGWLAALHADAIGRASMMLGAGRHRAADAIDPGVGLRILVKPGEPVRTGDAILELHFRDAARLEDAERLARGAIRIAEAPPEAQPLVVAAGVSAAVR